MLLCRLHDVIHAERRLYLVFEYLDLDLKKLMDATPHFSQNISLIKVREHNSRSVSSRLWQQLLAVSMPYVESKHAMMHASTIVRKYTLCQALVSCMLYTSFCPTTATTASLCVHSCTCGRCFKVLRTATQGGEQHRLELVMMRRFLPTLHTLWHTSVAELW